MTDSESSCSDDFEDAVESVEISVSPTSKAKRNTMKRGAVTSEEVRARGGGGGDQGQPRDRGSDRDTHWGSASRAGHQARTLIQDI